MKRIASLIAALALILALTSCGGGGGGGSKTIDLAALKDTMISDLSITEPLDLPADQLTALYGIDAADVKNSACFITMGGTFPDEIVMIEAADADALGRISESLNKRLEEVKNQSQSYDAENLALAQACKVMESGNYVALFLSPQHEAMEKLFEDASK